MVIPAAASDRSGDVPVQSGAAPAADTLPTIELVRPMPGFPGHRRFVLVRLDADGLLYAFTSADDPQLRFMVVPPPAFFPDYAPEIDDETMHLLGVDDPEQVLVLLVVTVGESPSDATANLMAPILVDQINRRAVQAVLTGSGLPVRAPLTTS
ncbi:flagellar assembly factor FliW [Micromonospora pattaloongensis]|uniref:Flagellar assembly factor FliW n=1 Tax=Micromonospora pattaloongensis TaxID=405436 RepID=A0A1H3MVV0_9ACTN|nr:flagellar assembly protein FliW [Micromonospora pattaloongensis]SDY80726.1 flagellar assembly factor FliW [Micromonospora pattaloongensis]